MNNPNNIIINKDEFRRKVEKLTTLPMLPHLMMKFTQMAKDPHTSMSAFSEEVSKDHTLTSKLLRLVNSAFYGFPGRISTVTQALVLLGIDALKGLIVTSNVFDGLTPEAYPLWRHSLLVSLTARQICLIHSIPDVEECAVAGLLHDIGKVILFLETPNEYRLVIQKAKEENVPIFKMEREIMGFDHAEIGEWICKKWTLPAKLAYPIGFHHNPVLAQEYKTRTNVVALANAIVKGIGASAEEGISLENLPECVENDIKLNSEQLNKIIEKVEPEIENLKNIGPSDLDEKF
ncbi:MAG: metal dependent phosphohydrolase [uncultured bacterium]|nr:MAG: metal dependent phosphohydrolase [uncultured bacterium]